MTGVLVGNGHFGLAGNGRFGQRSVVLAGNGRFGQSLIGTKKKRPKHPVIGKTECFRLSADTHAEM